jgi:hypothetical protein
VSIATAQKAKAEKALQQLVRSADFGVTTKAEYIRRHKEMGATVSVGEKPKAQWNRTKYNRMNGREQQEYERKMAEMIPCYKLHTKSTEDNYPSVYIEISKTEYDYFNSL